MENKKRYTVTFKLNEEEHRMLINYQKDHLSITPKSLMMEALRDRLYSSYDHYRMDFEG